MAAELKDPHLEGDPRPRGGLFKDHPQAFPEERLIGDAGLVLFFQACGPLQDQLDILSAQVMKG